MHVSAAGQPVPRIQMSQIQGSSSLHRRCTQVCVCVCVSVCVWGSGGGRCVCVAALRGRLHAAQERFDIVQKKKIEWDL